MHNVHSQTRLVYVNQNYLFLLYLFLLFVFLLLLYVILNKVYYYLSIVLFVQFTYLFTFNKLFIYLSIYIYICISVYVHISCTQNTCMNDIHVPCIRVYITTWIIVILRRDSNGSITMVTDVIYFIIVCGCYGAKTILNLVNINQE